MEDEKIVKQALELAGKTIDFASEKAIADRKTARWNALSTIVIALIFGVTICVTVTNMWSKYMDKAYNYTQMEQETKTDDAEVKQSVK